MTTSTWSVARLADCMPIEVTMRLVVAQESWHFWGPHSVLLLSLNIYFLKLSVGSNLLDPPSLQLRFESCVPVVCFLLWGTSSSRHAAPKQVPPAVSGAFLYELSAPPKRNQRMNKLIDRLLLPLVAAAFLFASIGSSTAQTLAPLITPYVNESDMASIQQIFNSNPDLSAPDLSLRHIHDGLDIAPAGNLKPFRPLVLGQFAGSWRLTMAST